MGAKVDMDMAKRQNRNCTGQSFTKARLPNGLGMEWQRMWARRPMGLLPGLCNIHFKAIKVLP